jgi:hypothetical protein
MIFSGTSSSRCAELETASAGLNHFSCSEYVESKHTDVFWMHLLACLLACTFLVYSFFALHWHHWRQPGEF